MLRQSAKIMSGDCSEDTVIQVSGEEERIGEQKVEYSIVRAHVHGHTHIHVHTYVPLPRNRIARAF
jgi:hypothetical protein